MHRGLLKLLLLVMPFAGNTQDSLHSFSYSILASKNNRAILYKPGSRLLIKYKEATGEKVRGIFTGVIDDKIIIATKGNHGHKTLVPVEDIAIVRKIRPGKRVLYSVIGAVLIGGGAAIVDHLDNRPGSGMAVALIIPVIGCGVYSLCAIPASLLSEKLAERKRSNGWSFSVERYR